MRSRARLLAALLCSAAAASQAGVLRYCDPAPKLSAAQKDRLLRFAAIVKDQLEKSGRSTAIVARSGLDLSRFGHRYSHSGLSLKTGADTAWSVRQLYYACDERRPRLYDQGMSAFLFGTEDPALGYLSAVLLPDSAAVDVDRVALDNAQALQMLGTAYSANAYPFDRRYQNCNQWVLETLAWAWRDPGAEPTGAVGLVGSADPRAAAQGWLQQRGYEPSLFDVSWRPLMWASTLIPWVHGDDHPAGDLAANVYRVSMPASIEAFVHANVPDATRIEICHNEHQAVVHRGWSAVGEGCTPSADDTVIPLDS